MTKQEIIALCQNSYIDEQLDSDEASVLFDNAYDRINSKRAWFYLTRSDVSNTIVAGTKAYNGPSDFLFHKAARFYDSARDLYPLGRRDLKPVRFQDRRAYYNSFGFYFVDPSNNQVVLTFNPTQFSGMKLEQDFTTLPAALDDDEEPVFLRTFHPIIAYEMAAIYYYKEQDEKDRSYVPELKREYDAMYNDMVKWDKLSDAGADKDLMPTESWLPNDTSYGLPGDVGAYQ